MIVSEYWNGNRKAEVIQDKSVYLVSYYKDDKYSHQDMVNDEEFAEAIAEEWVSHG